MYARKICSVRYMDFMFRVRLLEDFIGPSLFVADRKTNAANRRPTTTEDNRADVEPRIRIRPIKCTGNEGRAMIFTRKVYIPLFRS